MHSPNDFMYTEFLEHKKIFNMPNKWEYMMLSSGTNQFPMPSLWKELITEELNMDFTYQLYVSPYGFETVNKSLVLYENFISTQGQFLNEAVCNNEVCMTIGSSQAASLVMDYIQYNNTEAKIILVGKNYALYEMVSKKHEFEVKELQSNMTFLPHIDMLINYIRASSENSVFVFSHPNNPSGEQYSQQDFDKIVKALKMNNCFGIFDEVCNMVITNNNLVLIETAITKNNYWKKSIIINSFSKTESVAGMRIGYIYAYKHVIDFIVARQSDTLMSLPTTPVLPLFFCLMFRCIFLNNKFLWHYNDEKKIIQYFKKMFLVTTSIPSNTIKSFVENKIENIESFYNSYIQELLDNEAVINVNLSYLKSKLGRYLINISKMENGFNLMVQLRYTEKYSEIYFVLDLLEKTGLAVLTESSFCLEKKEDRPFWFRISLACETMLFCNAVDKLYKYLSLLEESSDN